MVLAALTIALATRPAGGAGSDDVRDVFVTNFPATQNVEGTVSVAGTIHHALFRERREIQVPPVARHETTRLIDGGSIAMEGFTSVVLTLNGRVQRRTLRPGTVGAILIPDEASVLDALEEVGQFQFPLETSVDLGSEVSRFFASDQRQFTLAFPRYRVRLYNTTDTTVTVNLFAYATH